MPQASCSRAGLYNPCALGRPGYVATGLMPGLREGWFLFSVVSFICAITFHFIVYARGQTASFRIWRALARQQEHAGKHASLPCRKSCRMPTETAFRPVRSCGRVFRKKPLFLKCGPVVALICHSLNLGFWRGWHRKKGTTALSHSL